MTNPAIPLWFLVALFTLGAAAKVFIFTALAKKIGPKFLTILESLYRSRTEADALPASLQPSVESVLDAVAANLNLCAATVQLDALSDEPWKGEEKQWHICTRESGHEGEHSCDCGQLWPVEPPA